jgi:membrane associated rhomboid family serine protease
MIFVLGLGHKLRNLPISTILMIVICGVYYFGFQSRVKPYELIAKNNVSLVNTKEYFALFEDYLVAQKEVFVDKEITKKVVANYREDLRKSLDDELSGKKVEKKKKNVLKVFEAEQDKKNKLLYKFNSELSQKEDVILNLKSFPDYKRVLTAKNGEIKKIHKEYNLLSRNNISILSAIVAMFSHGGIMHLVGNMVFLFFFGRYVEQRFGSLMYLAVYLCGGLFAMIGYAYFQSEDSYTSVLGASANVSVIMGAFYVSFYHHKMKIYVWYLFMAKVVDIGIKKFFPILFILQDVVFSFIGGAGIAHLAHVNGLFIGMTFGYLWQRKNKLPKDFLYPFEFEKWRVIKTQSDDSYYEEANKLLEYNPGNSTIKSETRKHIFKSIIETNKLSREMHLNLLHLIPDYIEQYIVAPDSGKEFYSYMNKMSSKHMSKYLKRINQKKLLILIDRSIDSEEYFLSIHFIHNFFIKYPRSSKIINMSKTLRSILDHSHDLARVQKLLVLLEAETKSNKFRKLTYNYIKIGENIG